MAKNNVRILQQFDRRTALIAPQYAKAVELFGMSAPARNESGNDVVPFDEMCVAATLGMQVSDSNKPFLFSGGIAVIPVYGCLLHRDSYCDEWATGYDYIRTRLAMALGDPEVKGIVFDVNSYGGMVAGNFELCDLIYAARGEKPMLALVDNLCFSGAYSIASSCDKIIVTPSSMAGSIGVVMMHTSYEGMLTENGIKVTFVFAGKHKVDGNPYQDLPDDVKATFQAEVDKDYGKFVDLVARNRNMTAEDVRATEAQCFQADDALALGLIDAIHSPSEALAVFRTECDDSDSDTNPNPTMGAPHMSKAPNAAGGDNATAADTAVIDPKTVAAPATAAAGDEAAPTAQQARTSERERMAGITGCEEAKGREALAAHFAYNTDMTVADAKVALAAAPVTAEKTDNAFEAAMAATKNPEVGAGDDGSSSEDSPGVKLAKAYSAVTGIPLRDQHKK